MGLVTGTQNALHSISQALLVPTILILLVLIAATAIALGSILAEAVSERRLQKEHVPALLASLHGRSSGEMEQLVKESGLLRRQKEPLTELLQYKTLPGEEQRAIAKRMLATVEEGYEKRVARTEIISRIAPMFGLMGTLIPLGPGIIALGQGDTVTLASSLLVAFDTTIAGLISGAVCFVITKLHRRWYESDLISLESAMECILEEAG